MARSPRCVTSVEPHEDGWVVEVEVIEEHRTPRRPTSWRVGRNPRPVPRCHFRKVEPWPSTPSSGVCRVSWRAPPLSGAAGPFARERCSASTASKIGVWTSGSRPVVECAVMTPARHRRCCPPAPTRARCPAPLFRPAP
ncbi:gas vesicle protein GvpO [Amycolatopsis carbonis]|uniref:Gas vesicle protein GvpO n=1 Tax=Amycolatopsis carbonis TaxID=715471 RepID=A0A9Y2MZR8_9PSEU|nr:gas vesicle protein GvpO [Amycolatopsis sp. 2-15]WIX82898.1 gas vesicle protein GvpO [Amycolatopsis sp. 2-15]